MQWAEAAGRPYSESWGNVALGPPGEPTEGRGSGPQVVDPRAGF